MTGEQVHVWPRPGLGTFPPEPHVKCGDTIHIAPHTVHGIETAQRAEEDIQVTGVDLACDTVLICGQCPDGKCRAVAYDVDAYVTRTVAA
jgi:hypothetical protein